MKFLLTFQNFLTTLLFLNCIFNFVFSTDKHLNNFQCNSDLTCNATYSVCKQLDTDGHTKGTCNCIVGYEPANDGYTCKRALCTDDSDCEEQHKNTVCIIDKDSFPHCECAKRFKMTKNQESCVKRSKVIRLNENCAYGGECGDNVECINQKCQCAAGTLKDDNGVNCSPVHCEKNSDCTGEFMDLACNTTTHQCYKKTLECTVGYEPNVDGHNCQLIKCKNDFDCDKHFENSYCHNFSEGFFRCECKEHFKKVNNECIFQKVISRLGNDCENTNDCGRGTECRNKKCQCALGNTADNRGINCSPIYCSKNKDCTAENKNWVCNINNHQCHRILSEEIFQIGKKCTDNNQCGNMAECTSTKQQCQCKDFSKIDENGVDCKQINCSKNSDCTIENVNWVCNVINQFCFNKPEKNSVKKMSYFLTQKNCVLLLLVFLFLYF